MKSSWPKPLTEGKDCLPNLCKKTCGQLKTISVWNPAGAVQFRPLAHCVLCSVATVNDWINFCVLRVTVDLLPEMHMTECVQEWSELRIWEDFLFAGTRRKKRCLGVLSVFFMKAFNPCCCLVGEKHSSRGSVGYTEWAKQADWSGRRTAFLPCRAGRDGCLPLTCLFLPGRSWFSWAQARRQCAVMEGTERAWECAVWQYFLPWFISHTFTPLCSYYRMPFCCPGVGISSFQWLKKEGCLCFLLDVNVMFYRWC